MKHLALVFLLALAACEKKPEALPVLGQVPGFELTASTNQAFASKPQLSGKIWVADLDSVQRIRTGEIGQAAVEG